MSARSRIIAGLAGATLLVAFAVAVSLWAFGTIEEAAAKRSHTSAVVNSGIDLLSSLKDAETGQRGYLLTGDNAFLEPYLAARDRLPNHLKELRALTSLRPAQEHLDAMAPMLDAKLEEMSHAI